MENIQTNGALNVASTAAVEVGKQISQGIGQLDRIQISKDSRGMPVTDLEMRVEQQLMYLLDEGYPEFNAITKLSGDKGRDSDYCWLIDPLNGVQNFVHGHPHCAISIALQHQQETLLGVIYDPLRNELFSAHKGARAQMEGRSIRVSPTNKLSDSLLGTGFPNRQTQASKPWLKTFAALLPRAQGIHRSGSSALDLAYVAAGRYDGFWQFDMQPWDFAAGLMLVQEAGGLISGIKADEQFSESGNLIAGTPRVQEKLALLVSHSAA